MSHNAEAEQSFDNVLLAQGMGVAQAESGQARPARNRFAIRLRATQRPTP